MYVYIYKYIRLYASTNTIREYKGSEKDSREEHLHKWFFTTPTTTRYRRRLFNCYTYNTGVFVFFFFFAKSNKFKNLTFIEFFLFFFCIFCSYARALSKGAKIDLKRERW